MKIADLFARLSLKPDKGSFDAAERAIGALKVALVGLVSVKTVQWMSGLVHDTIAQGDAAVKTGQKLGLSAEAVQELGYAASQSGSNQEELTDALGKLAKSAQMAVSGSKESQKAFRAVGLDARKVANGTIPLDKALAQISDRFAGMQDDAAKSNISMDLFSRSGRNLIPFLNSGSKGIQDLRQNFRDLGGGIDNESAKSLEGLGDKLDDLKVAAGGIRNQLVVALLPVLQKVTDKVLAWVKNNRALIATKIQTFIKDAVPVIKSLADAFTTVWRIGEQLVRHWQFTLIVLGSLKAAMLLLRAGSIGAAMASAAAWVSASLPIIGIAALIAGLILIVQDLWVGFNGGNSVFMKLYDSAVEWIDKKLGAVLGRAFKSVREFLGLGSAVDTDTETESKKVAEGRITPLSGSEKRGITDARRERQKQFDLDWMKDDQGRADSERVWRRQQMLLRARAMLEPRAGELNTSYMRRRVMAQEQVDMLQASLTPQGRARTDAIERVVNVNSSITINTPAGSDANWIGRVVRSELDKAARSIANGGG